MSINKLLSRLKGLESEIKEAISEVESLKKAIVGEHEEIIHKEYERRFIESIMQDEKKNVGLDEKAKMEGSATRQSYTWYEKVASEEEAGKEFSATRQIDSLLLTPKFYERFVQHFTEGLAEVGEENQADSVYHRQNEKLYFICAQPNTKYYAWQLEVMLRNFNEMGILDNPKYEVHIVSIGGTVSSVNLSFSVLPLSIADSHTNLSFHYYLDTRATKHYPSSIRPNLLKQHFAKHPEIKTFFYHDCDMIFTKNDLDFTPFLQDDICYGSDVRFYISHDYIASKEHNVLEYMCQIAQIPLRVVRDNEHNCIGAQYLIKNVSADFWEEVEKISEELFLKITQRNNYIKAQNPQYHELQIFAADMWAVLWCLWKLGKKTIPHKFFDFAWATDTIERYNECNIYHNAGVTESGHGLFFKGEFQDKVPDKNLRINPLSACSPYYELVKQIMIVK